MDTGIWVFVLVAVAVLFFAAGVLVGEGLSDS